MTRTLRTNEHMNNSGGDSRMTDLIRDALELALRLETMRQDPPASLPRHWDRDGPTKDHGPLTAPRRAHGAHSAPPTHSWDHRSKRI